MDDQDLSIFYINIPKSKVLICRIFKILKAHEAIFIEIPKPEFMDDKIHEMTSTVHDLRIVIRKGYSDLNDKIRVYYTPQEIVVKEIGFGGNDDGEIPTGNNCILYIVLIKSVFIDILGFIFYR